MAETGGTEIPDLKKFDIQLLMQDFAQARRDIFEERKNSEKRISEERERSKWELDRTVSYYDSKVKDLEQANKALIGLLSRMQHDIDQAREGELRRHLHQRSDREKDSLILQDETTGISVAAPGIFTIPTNPGPLEINNSLFGMQKLPTKKDL